MIKVIAILQTHHRPPATQLRHQRFQHLLYQRHQRRRLTASPPGFPVVASPAVVALGVRVSRVSATQLTHPPRAATHCQRRRHRRLFQRPNLLQNPRPSLRPSLLRSRHLHPHLHRRQSQSRAELQRRAMHTERVAVATTTSRPASVTRSVCRNRHQSPHLNQPQHRHPSLLPVHRHLLRGPRAVRRPQRVRSASTVSPAIQIRQSTRAQKTAPRAQEVKAHALRRTGYVTSLAPPASAMQTRRRATPGFRRRRQRRRRPRPRPLLHQRRRRRRHLHRPLRR